jgi:cell division GTPase FtsZ
MSEEKGNRVVVTDVDGNAQRIKSDAEIVDENSKFEQILKERRKPKLETVSEKEESMEKEEDMTVMLVEQPDRSVNIGIVGVGQCGSKIAEEFYHRGYNAVAINTAVQDLKHINVPEGNKLFLDYALGGAAKDLDTGAAAAEEYADEILEHIEKHLEDCEILLLAISGGGGTGSGAAETIVNLMAQIGKPISTLYVLPLSSEDTLSKHNAVQTLAKLADLAQADVINSLIVVDNAKIELMFPGKSMAEFWKIANSSIVEPLHLFNKLSVNASEYTSLDPMDFSRIFIGTGDCSLYGTIEVDDYLEEEAISEAMITNLETGLLSGNFDLGQTRSAGIIITGSKEVLESVPATNIEYGFAMVSKICNEGTRVFRGVYEVPSNDNKLRIYSFFSGLGLPEERVSELKAEAEKHMEILNKKEDGRASTMSIDIGKKTKTTNAVDAMHKKIKNKHSAMSKLKKNSKRVVDRRRR